MPNASTFDGVKGTDKRGQIKRKKIFSLFCRAKVSYLKVRISERKNKFIWTFQINSYLCPSYEEDDSMDERRFTADGMWRQSPYGADERADGENAGRG